MKTILLNAVAIIAGLLLGSIVNMSIISLGSAIIPPPEGSDVSNMEGLAQAIQHYKAIDFITPFLAHALGTLVGACIAAKVAATHKFIMANVIGVAFLAGGVTMVFSLPSPIWFNALDLIVAYIPMAYLGHKLVTKEQVH